MSDIRQPRNFQELLDLAAKGLDHEVDRRTLIKLGAVALGSGLYMATALKWAPSAKAAGGYTGAPVSGGGMISGVVGFAGEFPTAITREVQGQPEVINRSPRTWCSLYGSPSGLENVFVGLESIPSGKPFTVKENKIDQHDATILPRFEVFYLSADGTTTGSVKLTIHNSDTYLHALKGKLNGRPVITANTPGLNDVTVVDLKKPGLYELNCGPHPWERGWRIVADNPYWTLTDAHGRFKLTDIPAGSYNVVVVGEGIKPQIGRGIKVEGGKNTKLEIPLGAKHLEFV